MSRDFAVWDDSYSVGSEIVDSQHKGLVAMTNELFRCRNRKGAAADVAFLRAVKKALEYAKTHFSTEEKYMVETNYPDMDAHIEEHKTFVTDILKIVREFDQDNAKPINLARFLKNWLLNHIALTDKRCAPYFSKCNVEGSTPGQ